MPAGYGCASVGRWLLPHSPSNHLGWRSALGASCPTARSRPGLRGEKKTPPGPWPGCLYRVSDKCSVNWVGQFGGDARCGGVTATAAWAFLCPSVVRCSWSTTGRNRVLTAPKGWPSTQWAGLSSKHGPGCDPGDEGEDVSGVVACLDVDAVPDGKIGRAHV